MLEGRGGNIGVSVGDDGVLMVDDEFSPLAPKIRAAIAHIEKGPLRFVLNTHFHGDHVGGNPVFGTEATIIAQDNVRERLSTLQKIWGKTKEPMDKAGWPVITFAKSLSVHFNGEEIRMIHLSHGHTDGDAIVYFTGSHVLHMGDLLFSARFPYIDLEHGGTLEGYQHNLDTVLAMDFPDDLKVIGGHGPLTTLEGVRALRDMIRDTVAIVRPAVEAGQSLASIQKKGLPARFDPWNWDFITTDRWIETIYKTYSEQSAN